MMDSDEAWKPVASFARFDGSLANFSNYSSIKYPSFDGGFGNLRRCMKISGNFCKTASGTTYENEDCFNSCIESLVSSSSNILLNTMRTFWAAKMFLCFG